jgi:hypothetical protein
VAVLRLHAASSGWPRYEGSILLWGGMYVRQGTKHVRAPRKRPNFLELRYGEVRRTHPLRRRVNRASVVEALEYVRGEAAYLALR